jgi:ADP-ribosylglycohydrolase
VLGRYGQAVCRLTHDHPRAAEATGLAVAIAGSCLTVEDGIFRAIQSVAYDPAWNTPEIVLRAIHSAQTAPGRVATLAALAPDSSGMSALAAGVYSALSFPDQDTTLAALTFAAKAPDGDSAAAMCGAFLGASHGYEALPTNYVSRLELGWVLDRLACDMALQLSENQAGPGWKTDVFHDDDLRPLDVWWEVKYPGA